MVKMINSIDEFVVFILFFLCVVVVVNVYIEIKKLLNTGKKYQHKIQSDVLVAKDISFEEGENVKEKDICIQETKIKSRKKNKKRRHCFIGKIYYK